MKENSVKAIWTHLVSILKVELRKNKINKIFKSMN
jgi:hypothetical protein